MVLTLERLHGLRVGAEGSNGDRHLCLERGMNVLKKNNNT